MGTSTGGVGAVVIAFPQCQADEDAWVDQAACRGRTALFFPASGERQVARERREQRARAICAGCAVRDRCRSWGRQHHEHGIWGGENDDDRVSAGYPLTGSVGSGHDPGRTARPRLVAAALDRLVGPTDDELEQLERAERARTRA